MPKFFAIAASLLKTVVVVATGALGRGDMLSVILISAIFELALQIRLKAGHANPRRTTCDRSFTPH